MQWEKRRAAIDAGARQRAFILHPSMLAKLLVGLREVAAKLLSRSLLRTGSAQYSLRPVGQQLYCGARRRSPLVFRPESPRRTRSVKSSSEHVSS